MTYPVSFGKYVVNLDAAGKRLFAPSGIVAKVEFGATL
jgi:hypothetical protein